MDANAEDYIAEIKEEMNELYQVGREWGMSEELIVECVKNALRDDSEIRPTKKRLKICRCLLTSAKLLWALCCLAGVLYVVVSENRPISFAVHRFMQQNSYSLMRVLRLAILPFHVYFNVSSIYNSDCLISNPLFSEYTENCEMCSKINPAIDFIRPYEDVPMPSPQPYIFMNLVKASASFKVLKKIYLERKAEFDKIEHQINSSDESITGFEELFSDHTEQRVKSEDIRTVWLTLNTASPTTKTFQNYFPRPHFIENNKLSETMHFFMDGPGSLGYKLPRLLHSNVAWYVQSAGSRLVSVVPTPECTDVCPSFNFTLQSGYILAVMHSVWHVKVEKNGDSTSIGFLSFYDIQ